MKPDPQPTATGTLVTDALAQLSRLLRGEVALARAEIADNIRAAGAGIVMILAAVVLALTALDLLGAALVAALAEVGVSPGWAASGIGAVFGLVALLLALKGAQALKPSNLAPSRTAKNMRRDAETMKEIVSNDSRI